jgi:hypothetical protein
MARRGLGSPRLVWLYGSMVRWWAADHIRTCVGCCMLWRGGVVAYGVARDPANFADDIILPTTDDRPWMDGPLAWLSHPAPSHATPLSLRSDRTNTSEPGRWRTGILLISATARLTRRRPPHSPSPPDARPSFVPTDVSPRPSPWHPPSDCKYFAKWAGMLPMLP